MIAKIKLLFPEKHLNECYSVNIYLIKANQKIETFCVYLMKIKLNYSSLQTFIIGLIKISILNAFLKIYSCPKSFLI